MSSNEREKPCVPEIRKLYIALDALSNRYLKTLGLTSSQSIAIFEILENQERHREPMNQRDLEAVMAMSNPAVTGIVTRLEAKGFIRRVKRDGDKRFNYLEPTEKSYALRGELYPYLVESEKQLFAGFTAQEKEAFLQTIERCLKNLET